ncbi:MAG: hypothetical protein JWN36_188 [Microbacteriaceae bacterium]|nr:hypothetical protein [Microbacteriaceae bacterium]
MRTVLSSVLLAGMVALTVWSVVGFGFVESKNPAFIAITGGLWLLFAAAIVALRKVPAKAAVVLILAGSVALGGAAMAGPPNTSTDSARYAWDGIVQDAGISPYAHVPVDDALSALRPEWLFPTPDFSTFHTVCHPDRTHATTSTPSGAKLCTAINRSTVPTIYPPAAELYFAGVRAVVGPNAEYWPLQLTGALLSLGVTAGLLLAMRRRGMNVRWAALWAWSPLVATEAVTNSHVDVLGALLVLVATLLVADGKRWRGGIALGAAIAVKLIPVIAAPALLRRQPWKVALAAIGTFALLYVPYVLTTGIGVLGYLPGYLNEEGYDSGSRFALLSLIVPKQAAIFVAGALLVATAVLVWRKTDPTRPWTGQVVMIGVTLLIVSPRYPWYALMLVPFIALSGRWEWFAVPLALTVRLVAPYPHVFQASLAVAVLVIVGASVYRRVHRTDTFRSPQSAYRAPGREHA